MSRENKCWRCLGWIHGEKMRLAEKEYHPNCYFCDICKKSLKGSKVHEESGKLYDEQCYITLQNQKCAHCRTLIRANAEYVRGKSYHSECFTCYGCNQSLSGKSFHFADDGHFYDEICYRNSNTYKCSECKGDIDGNGIEFSIYQGKYYHHRCFACAQCRKPLGMQKFKIMLGQKYCPSCR